VDKKPLIQEYDQLTAELEACRLTTDQRVLIEGQMETVMDCLVHVVPKGHHAAIERVVACLEDASFDVRMTALKNIVSIAGKSNAYAIGCIASRLASTSTYTRWSSAECLLVMDTKGNREVLSQILVHIDNTDRFIRQDIVGAMVGVLLPSDYLIVIQHLGTPQMIEQAKQLQSDAIDLRKAAEAKSIQVRETNKPARKEAKRLEHEVEGAKRDLADQKWLDANPCLIVTQRKQGLLKSMQALAAARESVDGSNTPEWEAVEENAHTLKTLCLDALQAKYADDKARRGATYVLTNHIPGLSDFANNIAGGVSTAWKSSSSMSKAKSAFGTGRKTSTVSNASHASSTSSVKAMHV